MRTKAGHSGLLSSATSKALRFFSSTAFLKLTLAWFVLQGIFFSIYIKFGVPPDENYHFSYIQLFAEHFPSPFLPPQQGYDVIQESVHNPFFLYHYLLSFPYKLINGWDSAYIVIRLLNVALGLASLLVLVRLAGFIKASPLVRNLSVFMLVNTLMFTFLFSAISYDNLFVFLSLASFLLLLELIKKINATKLLLMLVVLSAGVLTKVNFLPIAFAVFLIFIISYVKRPGEILSGFKKTFSASKKLNYFLIVLFSFLGLLFIQRYVLNIVNYGTYEPSCTKVRTLEECRRNGLFVRNEKVYASNHPIPKKSTIDYTKDWVPLVSDRTYGIFAHKQIGANKVLLYWSLVILTGGFILILLRWPNLSREFKILFILSIFYSFVLFLENMHLYNASGRFGFAVHGRYLFAVLPVIYLLWNMTILTSLKRSGFKLSYVLITSLIFFTCSFPYFIADSTPDWNENNKKVFLSER